MKGIVQAVSCSPTHTFIKPNQKSIRLLTGLGVEGDAHMGKAVQHRSRVARDPSQPNLRQVHLIHAELHDELQAVGFVVSPGQMGENVTTRGIALLGLPPGTRLRLGETAVVEVTGLRNPCLQLDDFQPGLMAAVLSRDEHGVLIRKAGVMAIVLAGGEVHPSDPILVELPPPPVLATWDIRSENRSIVPNGACFFAKASEIRVQSIRSMLLVFSGHAPIFTKEGFSSCFVCSSS